MKAHSEITEWNLQVLRPGKIYFKQMPWIIILVFESWEQGPPLELQTPSIRLQTDQLEKSDELIKARDV